MIDTRELRKLAKAATPPGGWYVELGDYIYGEKDVKDVTDGEEWEPVIVNTEEGGPVNFEVSVAAFIAVANPAAVLELLDRLEAAENDSLEQARLNGIGAERELALMAKLEAAGKERDALRAKIERMEKGVPEEVEVREDEGHIFSRGSYNEGYDNGWNDCREAMLAAALNERSEFPEDKQ